MRTLHGNSSEVKLDLEEAVCQMGVNDKTVTMYVIAITLSTSKRVKGMNDRGTFP